MGLPRLHQKLSDEEPRLITKAYDIRAHGAVIRNIYFDIANARIVIASFFHANNKFWNIQLIDACSKIFCCLDSILKIRVAFAFQLCLFDRKKPFSTF